jgi:molecular chaperone GrpE
MAKNTTKTKQEDTDNHQNQATIEELDAKCQDLEEKYKRALADYQNLEKRVREEKVHWILAANKELIQRMLPVLDTLLLASKHTDDQGIKMTVTQFIQALENEGAKRIKTEGATFDPNTMEAVEIVEGEDNKVIEEIRPGFELNGAVIRPAQVKVGKVQN